MSDVIRSTAATKNGRRSGIQNERVPLFSRTTGTFRGVGSDGHQSATRAELRLRTTSDAVFTNFAVAAG